MNNVIDSQRYEKESRLLKNYLNHVVGIIAFSFALTCLSFENSKIMAWFTAPIVFALFFSAPRFKSIEEANVLIGHAANEEDRKLLKYNYNKVVNKESKWQFLTGVIIYIYGASFYLLLLFMPNFDSWIKAL